MEILKTLKSFFFLSFFLFFNFGCTVDGTITQIYVLETDTFISTSSTADHSELDYLSVYKSGTEENRVLVKLPTGHHDSDSNLDGCISNPLCFVFFLPMAILKALINGGCSDASFTAANLNWAYLAFDTVDSSSPAAGSLEITLLNQPWWHTVNWETAHPFSSDGRWDTPGGSLDTSTSFESNCNNLQGGQSCGAGEVKFEMTDYFRSLLNNENSAHFGFALSAPTDLAEVRLHSVQASSNVQPRVVANYNCVTTSSKETSTYYLGHP